MITGLYNYWIVIVLMMAGLYVVLSRNNMIKIMVGLNIFQTSVILFFVSMGKVEGGSAPIYAEGIKIFSNPIPHVLMLTAIVVSVATAAVGLALIVRIKESFGTIESNEISEKEKASEQPTTFSF